MADPIGRTVSFDYTGAQNTSSVDAQGGVTRYRYDVENHLVAIVDPRGNEVSNAYDGAAIATNDGTHRTTTSYGADGTTTMVDARGTTTVARHRFNRLTSLTRAAGRPEQASWTFAHDGRHMAPISVVDPDGRTTTTTYDERANALARTDGLGRVTRAAYNAQNRPVAVTDPLGVTTTIGYTGGADVAGVERPLDATGQPWRWSLGYDPARPGDLVSAVDPNGHTWRRSYDGAGNLVAEIDPLGNTTTFGYDTIGRRRTTTSPKGNAPGADPGAFTWTWTYNNFSDPTSVRDPLGNTTTYGWDPARNLTSRTDGNGHATTWTFDRYDQPATTRRADGTTTGTTYDTNGNIETATDGLGRVTRYRYDALDQVVSATDPLGRVTTYGYDRAGNTTSVTDAAGRATTLTYDGAGQRRRIDYADPATADVVIDYDANGRRVTMADGSGTNRYTYDSLNRLASHTNGAGQTVTYGWDLRGRLERLGYPALPTVATPVVRYSYDPAGRMTAVTDWLARTTTFDYDANANAVTTRHANGTVAQASYDDAD
ncbi:MAG: hypothetical protein ACRDY5_06090, partial [Acidimicrobiales bacterium]